ncbi:MAG: SDR family NAD(P)-dependent oxidoreductase [Ignavibacteriaceae bacterium]
MKMKHLIIGFTGGIGRATAKALLEKNEHVVALVRNLQKAEKYAQGLSGVEFIQGDAANLSDIEKALENCSTLFYCSNIPYPRWQSEARELLSVSITAAINKKAKLVFPGNVYVYGKAQQTLVNEGHPHAALTKKGKIRIEMEQMIVHANKEHGVRFSIIRMPDFYGPFVINSFSEKIFQNALRGKKLQWFGGLNVPIELIYIEDGGEAMAIAGLSPKADAMQFNVSGYSETTAKKFLKEISKQAGKHSKISSINIEFLVALAGLFNPMAKEFKEMMYLKSERLIMTGELFRTTFDTLPATPYEEGIRKTLEWTKNFFK